jgi:16S rRNA G966 N2-methylase RsmD
VELEKMLDTIEGSIILYMDPPFSIRTGMDAIYDKTIQTIESLDKNKIFLIAIEHMSSLKLPIEIGHFVCKKSKRFGKSSLTLYM